MNETNSTGAAPSPLGAGGNGNVTARSLAFLYGAGATLLLASVAVPQSDDASRGGLVAVSAAAFAVTALLLIVPERTPTVVFHLPLGLGTVLISLCVLLAGPTAAYAMFYVWVALYAFYFFTRRQATAHLVGIAAAYGAVLAAGTHTGEPFTRWGLTVGTVAVAGLFVARLVDAIRVGAAEATARAERQEAAERRTRSIIDSAGEGYMALDEAGRIVDVNPVMQGLTGWSREELVGESAVGRLVSERFREPFEAHRDSLGRGMPEAVLTREMEMALVHRAGHELPVEVTLSMTVDADGRLFNAFVREVSERKRAEQQMRDQIEDLEIVAGVARDISGVSNADAARPAICKAAVQLAGASVGILYELDRKGTELTSTAVVGSRREPIHLPFAGPPSGAATVFSSGRPLFVADLRGHPSVRQPLVDHLGVASALWQPILRNDVPIGVLAVAWQEPVERVTPRVGSLIALLAAEAAAAIERADLLGRLEAVARTDDLTGLANRRAWEEQLPRELSRARRDEAPLCVAMLDLDHFKAYNDDHGHPAGDRLLKEATAVWRGMLRPSDLLSRYGGEEFVLLLPQCDIAEGLEVVERLRGSAPEGQTCSAGLARWDGRESPDALVARADRALYEAKAAGRDRSAVA